MTVLSVSKEVSKYIGLTVPDVLLSSTARELVELASVAQEMAESIANGNDWQVLSRIHTITGDGTTEAFDLPSDYDRMVYKSELWSSSLQTPLIHILDLNEWLGMDVRDYDYVFGAWTIYGGQLQIKPALATGVTVKLFYVSNLIVKPVSGVNAKSFVTDSDIFRVDERLLKLAMIWRWKEMKGQPYAEWMQDFEVLKERLVMRDRGSKMLTLGRGRISQDAEFAYPKVITP
jgi:hypothetical protein